MPTPTGSTKATPRKPLSASQKALAERTVKVTYNGLINSLSNAKTKVEMDNQPLPYPMTLVMGMPYGTTSVNKGAFVVNGVHKAEPTKAMLAALDKANKAAEEYNTLLADIVTKAREVERLIQNVEKEVQDETNRISKKNDDRKARCLEAAQAKMKIAEQLQAQRDQHILKIAFDGEPAEMLDFLKALPGPADIMKEIKKAGFELASPISEKTGVGDVTPKSLTGSDSSAAVQVNITTT